MHHSGKFVRNGCGIALSNPNGLNMGVTYSSELKQYITFICCRKEGIPVGPEWAWRLDGSRFYYNLWSSDKLGKLLAYKVWNRDEKINSEQCSICMNKMNVQTSSLLSCGHSFHYDCLAESSSLRIIQCCPVCSESIKTAISVQNKRWLCSVEAKDIINDIILVKDIFENKLCIRFRLQHYLPGFHSAKNMNLIQFFDSNMNAKFDAEKNVLCLENSKGKIFVGNVLADFGVENFNFPHNQYLIDNDLESCGNILQSLSMKDFQSKS